MAMFSPVSILFFIAHVTSALSSSALVVETVPDVTLTAGKPATLTCNFKRSVFAVHWRYQSSTASTERLVTLDKYYDVGKRSGPGYDEGRFNITDDYSLIIHDVEAKDEGKYICEVSDFESGSARRNHTNVVTVVMAERPFVRIEECENDVHSGNTDEHCVYQTTPGDSSIDLTCSVVGAKPAVDLTWKSSMSSDDWKQGVNKSMERTNGVFDQTLPVIIDTSRSQQSKPLFTCIAEGLAVHGVANLTIEIRHAKEGVTWTIGPILAVVIGVVCALLFPLVIFCIVKKVGKRIWREKEMIRKLRSRKANKRVYLGVLGDENAGKSSFIESIRTLAQASADGDGTDGNISSETWEETAIISEGLRIRKLRDKKEIVTPEDISAILRPKGKDKQSLKDDCQITDSNDLIHYPIFVFDIRNRTNWNERLESLRKFSGAVHKRILQYPMIVLTKASASTDQTEEDSMEELISSTGIPRENILVTFEFVSPNDGGDKHTRFEQLEFITKCIDKVDTQNKSIKKRLGRQAKGTGEKDSYRQVPTMNTDV